MIHIEVVTAERPQGLFSEIAVIPHIQTDHAMIYVYQIQQSPPFQKHTLGCRNCTQDSLFGQGVSYSLGKHLSNGLV